MFYSDKLPPLNEWEPDYEDGSIEGILTLVCHGNANTVARAGETYPKNTLNFILDARRALEIQQKLGWFARMTDFDTWDVFDKEGRCLKVNWDNPYTAICEAYDLIYQGVKIV